MRSSGRHASRYFLPEQRFAFSGLRRYATLILLWLRHTGDFPHEPLARAISCAEKSTVPPKALASILFSLCPLCLCGDFGATLRFDPGTLRDDAVAYRNGVA